MTGDLYKCVNSDSALGVNQSINRGRREREMDDGGKWRQRGGKRIEREEDKKGR